MRIRIQEGLPFVKAVLEVGGQSIELETVLLDTGSGGTLVAVDRLQEFGIQYEPTDLIYRIFGVGGSEFVFAKRVELLRVGELSLRNFEVEVGGMDYGLEMDGILGLDFLSQVGAVIDLGELRIW